jgi:hypothetical protein
VFEVLFVLENFRELHPLPQRFLPSMRAEPCGLWSSVLGVFEEKETSEAKAEGQTNPCGLQ